MDDRPNLPERILSIEQAVLVGDALAVGIYGVLATIYVQAVMALLTTRKGSSAGRPWLMLAYCSTIFAIVSIYTFMDLHSLKLMFTVHREYTPNGPVGYALSEYGKPITVIPNICAILAVWLTDGFLLYRCLVIFQLRLYVVGLPIFIYLGTIAMGIMVLFQSSRPDAHLWTTITVNFGIPYFAGSAFLNLLITSIITTKLILHRRALTSASQAAALRLNYITTVLIESSALCAVFSITFVVAYGLRSHVSNAILPMMTVVQVLATMLIILRVANRRTWDAVPNSLQSADPTSLLFGADAESTPGMASSETPSSSLSDMEAKIKSPRRRS